MTMTGAFTMPKRLYLNQYGDRWSTKYLFEDCRSFLFPCGAWAWRLSIYATIRTFQNFRPW